MTPSDSLAVVRMPNDCGNAPRKALIRDFTIALYRRNANDLMAWLKDNVLWEVVGSGVLAGIDEVQAWLLAEPATTELSVNTIITHGWECGVDGTIVRAGGLSAGFCHILLFAGAAKTAKIKEIRSYLIDSPSR